MNATNNKISMSDALNILDRTIGYINSCDNRASIVLGINGVALTLAYSNKGLSSLPQIINSALSGHNFFYLIFLTLTIASLCFGIFKLIHSLMAKTNYKELQYTLLDIDSKIYFRDIALNKAYKQYKEKLLECNEDILLNDVISQIYLSSIICMKEHLRYNLGLITSLTGLFTFILFWVLGTISF